MNLKQVLRPLAARLFKLQIPEKRLTVTDSTSEPPAMAPNVSADRIMGIVTSAEQGNTRDLFSLYRDVILTNSHLQSEIFKRKLAVLGDTLSFMPFDKKSTADKDAADRVDAAVSSFKGWMRACSCLLDASLYPVSVVEKSFEADSSGSGYRLSGLTPVPYHLLDFTNGRMMIFDADPSNGQPLATKHDVDPNRYIVHHGHLLTSPDNWGGPMRSVLFWWLLASMSREWWAKFLEKYGTPFLVGKFEDEDGRTILERAFALASVLGGLAVSERTSVEIKQAAASDSGEAYKTFLSIAEREMSKLVLGQTLSAEAQPTGMNSGTSNMQEEVRQDIRRFDAKMLSETLRDQLITQYCRINRIPGQVPLLAWGSESQAKIASTISLLTSLKEAGLRVTDEGLYALSEKTGLELERDGTPAGISPFSAAYSRSGPPARRGRISAEQMDMIADKGSPDLARAYRGAFAPVAQIIRDSRSPEECEAKVRHYYADWDHRKIDVLCSEALIAYAINGTVVR